MHYRALPPIEELYDLFVPDFEAGTLVWKYAHGRRKIGDTAGFQNDRYMIVGIKGARYYVHRVLYAMYHQADPGELEIDHSDGDRLNNSIANLREATRAQNGQNIRGYRKGLKGAYKSFKGDKPWMSTIQKDGTRHYLGAYATEEEAHEAYVKASAVHHGTFGRAA